MQYKHPDSANQAIYGLHHVFFFCVFYWNGSKHQWGQWINGISCLSTMLWKTTCFSSATVYWLRRAVDCFLSYIAFQSYRNNAENKDINLRRWWNRNTCTRVWDPRELVNLRWIKEKIALNQSKDLDEKEGTTFWRLECSSMKRCLDTGYFKSRFFSGSTFKPWRFTGSPGPCWNFDPK